MAKPKALGGLGFQDFQTYNVALLAKIGWRLLQNPNCLLGRVLMGKYCPENDILLAKETSTMSHGWRSILLGRDLLVQNLGWAVGNGQSINVWQDPWLSCTAQERPMGPIHEHLLELRVAELKQPESCEWDLQKIQLYLPSYIEAIQGIRPSHTGAPDKQIWLGTKTGEYTTKSGYYAAVNNEEALLDGPQGGNFNWVKNIWKLDCAPKVKMFSWKLLKGAIPVGVRVNERHVPVDPACKRCGEAESITHLFFHCQYA